MKKNDIFGKIDFFDNNGLKGAVVKRGGLGSISISLMIKGGDELNPLGKGGLSNLFATMMSKGTKKFSSLEIAEKLDFFGADFSFKADKDSIIFSFWFLKEHFDKIFPLIEEIFFSPTFPEDELNREKLKSVSSLYQMVDSPSALASYIFTMNIYSAHPYGNLPTPESISKITRGEIVNLYENIFKKNLLYLVVSGDLNAKIEAKLLKLFDKLPSGGEEKKVEKAMYRGKKFIFFDKPDSTQSQIRLGFEGLPRETDRYEVINLMNYILGGGGFSSRLLLKVRTEAGLTYSTSSSFDSYKNGGSFRVSSFSKTETTVDAIILTENVLSEFIEKGAKDKELKDAKSFYVGNLTLSLETPLDVAGKLMFAERYNLGNDFVFKERETYKRVKLSEVNLFAKKYLSSKNRLLVIVGNFSKIKNQLKKLENYGKVSVIEKLF